MIYLDYAYLILVWTRDLSALKDTDRQVEPDLFDVWSIVSSLIFFLCFILCGLAVLSRRCFLSGFFFCSHDEGRKVGCDLMIDTAGWEGGKMTLVGRGAETATWFAVFRK